MKRISVQADIDILRCVICECLTFEFCLGVVMHQLGPDVDIDSQLLQSSVDQVKIIAKTTIATLSSITF